MDISGEHLQEKPRQSKRMMRFAAAGFLGCLVILFIILARLGIKEIVQEVDLTAEKAESSEIGMAGPGFELEDLEGRKINSADFIGKPSVIIFWTTWNPVSADQLEVIDNLSSEIREILNIITVNSQENKDVVKSFMVRGKYEADVLLDENGEISELYKIKTTPAFYFLDKEGIIKKIHIGPLSVDEIKTAAESVY